MQIENGSQKAGCHCTKVQDPNSLPFPTSRFLTSYFPYEAAALAGIKSVPWSNRSFSSSSALEFSDFPEPMQSPLNLFALEFMTAGEMFQADLLKPGAFQRIKYSFLGSGPRNLICRAAAEPDGYAEEIGWRLVVMIGGA